MKGLVFLLGAVGVTLLVFWFWQEQMKGHVEPMPPLVAQLERMVEEGALGGQSPEGLVATLVFSDPFREADPWDMATVKKGGMAGMFGEPRELAFLEALMREPRTAGWRMSGAADAAEAQAQLTAAAQWAAQKGVRLRVVARGAALLPVLRGALALPPSDPPLVERLVGLGVRLEDVRAMDPALAGAAARVPAGQWLDLYSDPAVVPRSLLLETVKDGAAEAAELTWPGRSWVATVVELAQRGAPRSLAALPAPAPGSLMSARQFRSVKDGKLSRRVVDGKGNLVTGSLLVPKLAKEEIPPDPEANEKAPGEGGLPPAGDADSLPLGRTGWSILRKPEFTGLTGKTVDCVGSRVLMQSGTASVAVRCWQPREALEKYEKDFCSFGGGKLVTISYKGRPARICKESPPSKEFKNGNWADHFQLSAPPFSIEVDHSYPGPSWRDTTLPSFMGAIDALVPPK